MSAAHPEVRLTEEDVAEIRERAAERLCARDVGRLLGERNYLLARIAALEAEGVRLRDALGRAWFGRERANKMLREAEEALGIR